MSDDERRKNGGLSHDQIEAIKKQILSSVYEDIGRSIVKKVLYAGGAVLLALLSWLAGKDHIFFK